MTSAQHEPKPEIVGSEPGLPRLPMLPRSRLRALVDRLDPCSDPAAESIGPFFLIAFAASLFATAWVFLSVPVAPLQDFGMHVGLAAIVADRGRAGSLYDALYESFDPLYANSLLYAIAGYSGRFVGVLEASRACLVAYLVGMPVATLYALRVYGRSPWPAIAAVGLAYNMNFVAGFANFVFAAPFLMLSIAGFRRFLDVPSARRGAFVVAMFVATFLTHAHVYLFLGLVTMGMTAVELVRDPRGEGRLRVVARALVAAAPSLLLFGRWVRQVFGASAEAGARLGIGEGRDQEMLGSSFLSTDQLLAGIFDSQSRTTTSPKEGLLLAGWLGLFLLAVVLRGGSGARRVGALEGTFLLSFLLYFVLPDSIAGQYVIATRQVGVALWFLPVLLAPVRPRGSRLTHGVVVVGILVMTSGVLGLWHRQLREFHRTEAHGLMEVLRAAPPRLRLYAPRPAPDSAYFRWRVFWHVEPYYMGLAFGETPETPAIYAHNAVRYRPDVDYHRYGIVGPAVATSEEIWSYYDLVLFRRWHASDAVQRELESRATLVKRVGDWQLWRNRRATSAGAGPLRTAP